jgi:glycosyltransferase involved in cell wall biosynthesis
MQAQLTRIAADRQWRERLSAAGLARARLFDWRTTAEATLDAYARAAARHSHSSAAQPLWEPPRHAA